MNTTSRESRPSHVRAANSERGAVVVLDAGCTEPESIWGRIDADLERDARVRRIESRTPLRPGTVETIPFPDAPVIAVGWDLGANRVLRDALLPGSPIGGIVLIDPVPTTILSTIWSGDLPRNDGDGSARRASVDAILRLGARPNPGDWLANHWDQQLHEELSRFPRRREVIAGRSRGIIPRERPDVVLDAIAAYLSAFD
jgi:hypothetical protein